MPYKGNYNSQYYNPYVRGRSEGWYLDGGGNDEYYVAYCDCCDTRTEHDVCTDDCVECS